MQISLMVCGLVQLPVVTVLSAVEAGLEPSGYLVH